MKLSKKQEASVNKILDFLLAISSYPYFAVWILSAAILWKNDWAIALGILCGLLATSVQVLFISICTKLLYDDFFWFFKP